MKRLAAAPIVFLLIAAGLLVALAGALTGAVVVVASEGAQACAVAGPAVASPTAARDVPRGLMPIFVQGAQRYGLGSDGWAWLASINAQETNFGRDLSTSSAGAVGWMQFLPATWATYGVDANHDGRRDPADPWDAIFAAANYLHASGAPRDWHGAVLAYNHSESYYQQVHARAAGYVSGIASGRALLAAGPASPAPGFSGACTPEPATGDVVVGGYALPLQRRYMSPLGRTDDGVDIENAPDGAMVYSITPGVCTAVASNPGGFGPSYPVIAASVGSLSGAFVYYGHVSHSLVRAGESVAAGQAIAVIGHTGDAAGLGHGHIEIGFSDRGGNPLNHHTGASAATAAGMRMRRVLIALSAAAGIHAR